MNENNVTINPSAARRAKAMIGQDQARQEIETSLYPGDRSFQVVLVRAEGGMGKTRLLEEVIENHGRSVRVGQEIEWADPQDTDELGDLIIADLVDVIDTRLHDRYRFVCALRESLKVYGGSLNFSRFDAANDKVQLLTANGALLDSMNVAQVEATEAFIKDLAGITTDKRLVFLIDTAERLTYEASEWLLQRGLLKAEDLVIRTQQWLREFITKSDLENLTLILAGRGREGKYFFERIASDTEASLLEGRNCRLVDIQLKRLSLNQTREYFQQLAEDWRGRGPKYRTVAENFDLAADAGREQHKVIGLYTHGIPVRLALYAQVLAEGKSIPPAFRLSYREVCARAGLLPGQIDPDGEVPEAAPPELRQMQWQIEEQFIKLLFESPADRRAAVLRALVRAPRGLTAEQLHFALDAPTDQDPLTWQADSSKLENLVSLLESISHDYLGKRRSSLEDLSPVLDEIVAGSATFRIGLQDEIYRIYAEHIGLLADPVSEETVLIRESLSDADVRRYEQSREDEKGARLRLYGKLAAFADYQHSRHLAHKRGLLLQDEARFEQVFTLDAPHTYRFEELSLVEVGDRQALHMALTLFEIEGMIYRLLQDPERNLNSEYITLEDDNDKAARQEEDFWAQAEMWRSLHDDWLMKFVDLHERQQAKERGETSVVVLRRVAEQENVARWIKRFVLRGKTQRAIEFGKAVEGEIHGWPRGHQEDETGETERNRWLSWNHPLAREERVIWTEVGRIRRGTDTPNAVANITTCIIRLEKLFATDVQTTALVENNYEIRGFAATADGEHSDHPAYMRLRRLLSHAHNALGFSQRTLGHMQSAVMHYGKSLEYVRTDRGQMKAHRAKVLNNLSRALSELGWNSIDVCLDGRNLRLELAEEVPLAGSYNTLALIYDDLGRYEDAPLLSAKAIAYCRRANERRQLGLALRQMAESLRHVAERRRTGQRVAGGSENYFTAAETLLREARVIFEELGEAERLVEVNLELGSLFRDRMQPASEIEEPAATIRDRQKYYEKAREHLGTAERQARTNGQTQHVLDARINLARIYYYNGNLDSAVRTLEVIERDGTYKNHLIVPNSLPDPQNTELRDRNWVFRHLNTAQMIRGWIAFNRFEDRVDEIRKEHPDGKTEEERQAAARLRAQVVATDPIAQAALLAVAEAYSLGIAYAEYYSPRSRSIGSMQNNFYHRLRKANRSELDALHNHLQMVESKYPGLGSSATLQQLLQEFFGPSVSLIAQ